MNSLRPGITTKCKLEQGESIESQIYKTTKTWAWNSGLREKNVTTKIGTKQRIRGTGSQEYELINTDNRPIPLTNHRIIFSAA